MMYNEKVEALAHSAGQSVYAWRHQQGLSQTALGDLIGISQTEVSKIESGQIFVATAPIIPLRVRQPLLDLVNKFPSALALQEARRDADEVGDRLRKILRKLTPEEKDWLLGSCWRDIGSR